MHSDRLVLAALALMPAVVHAQRLPSASLADSSALREVVTSVTSEAAVFGYFSGPIPLPAADVFLRDGAADSVRAVPMYGSLAERDARMADIAAELDYDPSQAGWHRLSILLDTSFVATSEAESAQCPPRGVLDFVLQDQQEWAHRRHPVRTGPLRDASGIGEPRPEPPPIPRGPWRIRVDAETRPAGCDDAVVRWLEGGGSEWIRDVDDRVAEAWASSPDHTEDEWSAMIAYWGGPIEYGVVLEVVELRWWPDVWRVVTGEGYEYHVRCSSAGACVGQYTNGPIY